MKIVYSREKMLTRVKQMEEYFDTVQAAMMSDHVLDYKMTEIDEMIQGLKRYQESGQWLEDYECDERGELPSELKRGVLSEDGLYNLLSKVDI